MLNSKNGVYYKMTIFLLRCFHSFEYCICDQAISYYSVLKKPISITPQTGKNQRNCTNERVIIT